MGSRPTHPAPLAADSCHAHANPTPSTATPTKDPSLGARSGLIHRHRAGIRPRALASDEGPCPSARLVQPGSMPRSESKRLILAASPHVNRREVGDRHKRFARALADADMTRQVASLRWLSANPSGRRSQGGSSPEPVIFRTGDSTRQRRAVIPLLGCGNHMGFRAARIPGHERKFLSVGGGTIRASRCLRLTSALGIPAVQLVGHESAAEP